MMCMICQTCISIRFYWYLPIDFPLLIYQLNKKKSVAFALTFVVCVKVVHNNFLWADTKTDCLPRMDTCKRIIRIVGEIFIVFTEYTLLHFYICFSSKYWNPLSSLAEHCASSSILYLSWDIRLCFDVNVNINIFTTYLMIIFICMFYDCICDDDNVVVS